MKTCDSIKIKCFDNIKNEIKFARTAGIFGKVINYKVTNTKVVKAWIIGQTADAVTTILWNGRNRVSISTEYLSKLIKNVKK